MPASDWSSLMIVAVALSFIVRGIDNAIVSESLGSAFACTSANPTDSLS